MSNLSARLLMNEWLAQNGYEPISGLNSHTEFATALRHRLAPKQIQAPFTDRADAVRYVREAAMQRRSKPKAA